MEDYKNVSVNTICHLSLHDCVCARLYYDRNILVFDMEWMEVLSSHPDNPFDKAHQSGCGKIILSDPEIGHGVFIAKDPGGDKRILHKEDIDARDFEVLDFTEENKGNAFRLKLFGEFHRNPNFAWIEMEICYSSSSVMFDRLGELSWFEDEEISGNK